MSDDPRVWRWLRIAQFLHESDEARELRVAIVLLAEDPSDRAARDRLRALGADDARWEQLACFLAAEIRLTRDPAVVAALQQELAFAMAQVDRPSETIPELHATIERDATHVGAHDALARHYYLAGAWAKAAETLEALGAAAPDELGLAAWRAAGRLYRDHGRPDRALGAYRSIAIRRPGDRDALVSLGELLNDTDLPPAAVALEDAPVRPDTALRSVDDGAHLTLDEIGDDELDSGIAGLLDHTPVPMPVFPDPAATIAVVEAPATLPLDEPAAPPPLVLALAAPADDSEARHEEQRLRSALRSRPGDLLTHLALVELLCDDERIGEAVDHLRATIGKSRMNDAQLWCKLGDVERLRDKPLAALTAYRRTLLVAGDARGAAQAQQGLAELATLEYGSLHALVAREQHPADVLCLARELAQTGDARGAQVAFDLARALGVDLGTADHTFMARHPARAIPPGEDYAGALDPVEQRLLVDDPEDEPLRGLLEILGEAIAIVGPPPLTALERARIRDARPLLEDDPLGAIFERVALALGGPPPLVFASEDESHADPLVLLAMPPLIVVGPHLVSLSRRSLDHADRAGDAALRFDVGRAVELSRPHRVLAVGTSPDAFARIVDGLLVAFGPYAIAPTDSVLVALVSRFRGALPAPLRERLTAYLAHRDLDDFDPEAYRLACERAADRAGLLACGAVEPAIGLAGGAEHAPHLVRLAATPQFLVAERRLRG